MKPSISTAASRHLRRLIAEADLKNAVVTIVRSESPAGEDMGWNVALIEAESLAGLDVETHEGLQIFVDDQWSDEVGMCSLDVIDGRFVLTPSR